MKRASKSFVPLVVCSFLLEILLSSPALAQSPATCSFPAGYDVTAAKANWSFNPPACPEDTPNGISTAATPNTGPTVRIDGTDGAPNKVPYLRHPAGGDPVMGDGEFVESRTDAVLAGYGVHYEFTRTYRSRVNFVSPLGFGWDHNYDQRIIGNATPAENGHIQIDPLCDNTIDFQDGGLNRIHFQYAYSMNGSDYYQSATGVSFTLFSSKADAGYRYWTILDSDGTKRTFADNGYLAVIQDPAQNFLALTWEVDNLTPRDKVHGQPMRLHSVRDAARTVTYVYHDTQANYGVLQCITLGTTCTADSNLLVSFNITPPTGTTSIPAGPELLSVTHGKDQTGEQYVYFDQAQDAQQQLNLSLSPNDCLDSLSLVNYCDALCFPPLAGTPSSCGNLSYQAQITDFCSKVTCDTYTLGKICSPQDSKCTQCIPEGSRCFACEESNGQCTIDSNGAYCSSLSGTMQAASDGTFAPCCYNFNDTGAPDDLCLQYFRASPDCWVGCEDRYQCHLTPSGTTQSYSIYSFGVADDLRHNIVKVLDESNQVVVINQYGQNPAQVDFDKVVSQQLGDGGGDNVIKFEYHDLNIEAGTVTLPTFDGTPWPGTYSIANPIVINPFIAANASQWNGQELCPATCNVDSGCTVQTYGDAATDATWKFQLPESAVVIYDLHGRVRVQYLDISSNIIREIYTDTTATTDYNYDIYGFVHGVRAASGIRTCMEHDALGRLQQTTTLAANGYAGDKTPRATVYDYDSFGRVFHITVDPLGTPSTTTITRDPVTANVNEVDQDVGGGKPALKITYQYINGSNVGRLETPTQIQYPNGRIDTFSAFAPSMGGPQSSIYDRAGASPKTIYITYDSWGRVTETGEGQSSSDTKGRYAEHYTFDGGGRMNVVAHRMSGTSAWINKTVNYRSSTGQVKVDAVIDPLKTTSYIYSGQYPKQEILVATSAPAGTTLPATQTTCFRYSADGRLEEVALPEGNTLHYHYEYHDYGSSVSTYKDYSRDSSADWDANCPAAPAPAGDPGDGGTTVHTYTPGGFLNRFGRDDGYLRGFVYDGFGDTIQSDNNSWPYFYSPQDQYGYDVRGRVIWKATYASGYGISTDPSVPNTPYHKPLLTDAGLQSFSEYEYDFLNRKTKEHHWALETGEDLLVQYNYNDQASQLTVTDRGASTLNFYDGLGRLTLKVLPNGAQIQTKHYIDHDITFTLANTGKPIIRTTFYDGLGRILYVLDENNKQLSSASYDDHGNLLTSTNVSGTMNASHYDSFDRLVSVVQDVLGINSVSQYKWDRNNRNTQYTDAEGHNWTTVTFTGFDAPLTFTDPTNRTGWYKYVHGFSIPAGMTEPSGRQSSYRYNSDLELSDIYEGACPDGDLRFDPCAPLVAQRHYEYTPDELHKNSISKPISGTNISAQATVTQTYDSLGRPVDDAVGDSLVHHSYADSGRTDITEITYLPTSATATFKHHYDTMGRLASVDLNGNNIATWNYGTGIGNPLTLTYTNGPITTYQYDNRLRQIGMDVTIAKGTGVTAPVASLHDVVGSDSIARMRQRKFGANNAITDIYEVDSQGRMISERLDAPNITLPTGETTNQTVDPYMSPATATYTIDKIGNIQTQGGASSINYANDALSRLTAINGATVSHDTRDDIVASQTEQSFYPNAAYDEFSSNLLMASNSSGSTAYKYDALDRRIAEDNRQSGIEQLVIWDHEKIVARGPSGNLILEVPGDDVDSHIASASDLGAGPLQFYHQGPDQSVLAVSNGQGLVEGYSYSAFGTVTAWTPGGASSASSLIGTRFLFQGQLYDPVTATYSMRAREYLPKTGRFLSPDPLSTAAGPSIYSFTGSRPLGSRDPLGLMSCNGLGQCSLDDSESGWAMAAVGYQTSGLNYLSVPEGSSNIVAWDNPDPDFCRQTEIIVSVTFTMQYVGTGMGPSVNNGPLSTFPVDRVFAGPAIAPNNPFDCDNLKNEIASRVSEIVKRAKDLVEDKHKLALRNWFIPIPGIGSVQGHIEQFNNKQKNLQKMLRQWDDNNCGGKGLQLPDNTLEAATRPAPWPYNRQNGGDRFDASVSDRSPDAFKNRAISAIILGIVGMVAGELVAVLF